LKSLWFKNKEDIDFLTKYLNDTVNNDAALQGARDIIAEWINENILLFVNNCDACTKKATITTKVVKPKRRRRSKFNQYFDWSEPLTKHHRIDY
jgi:uncharacterized protein